MSMYGGRDHMKDFWKWRNKNNQMLKVENVIHLLASDLDYNTVLNFILADERLIPFGVSPERFAAMVIQHNNNLAFSAE